MQDDGNLRTFDTGATRDTATNKNDYEGFLSPLVIEAFGDYMTANRKQTDGSIRDSDNWQKGIPRPVYMKSAWRHLIQWWKLHRGLPAIDEKGTPVTMKQAIGGLLFNAMGYLHEYLKANESQVVKAPSEPPYPRFFLRAPKEGSSGAVFVIVAPNTGGSVLLSQLRHPDGPWGICNWSLGEMITPGAWSHNIPVEITAEEALRRGVPNNLAHWPVHLRAACPALSGKQQLIPGNA